MHKALSWDDARILLAVLRYGTQANASKMLSIDQATISRRLLRLEDAMGAALFVRDGTRLIPTDLGQRMAQQAEEAEAALATLFGEDAEAEATGVVRIAAPPFITTHVLAPALPLLRQLAPSVVAELVATTEGAGIGRRDADIALRLSKPGNSTFMARRVATVPYGVYARRGHNGDSLPWIGFDETLADCPEACWLARREGETVIARAADIQTLYEAVRAGIGRGLLPVALARRDGALVPLATPEPPARELWLLVERQVRQIRRVSLTLGWVEAVMRDAFPACAA
jgi:DNA-binding transcriptional LysR family regulator